MSRRVIPNYGSVTLATLLAAGVLASCGPTDVQAAPLEHRHVAQAHEHFGRVVAIHSVTTADKPSGAGAVLGGVVGGVLGHQIGGGSGRMASTAVGVAGGALVGHALEKEHARRHVSYRVTVREDNGHVAVFEAPQLAGLHVGERVRVDGGLLRHA